MISRPILFNAAMVNAILDGRKTQTRRIIFPRSPTPSRGEFTGWVDLGKRGRVATFRDSIPDDPCPIEISCPFGAPGDLLWVREAFVYRSKHNRYYYRADHPVHDPYAHNGWKPSIHMPRKASRLTLEVTDVRVERLVSITCGGSIAEGIESVPPCPEQHEAWRNYLGGHGYGSPISSFRSLWESINGAGSWAANPWVWAITFMRVET